MKLRARGYVAGAQERKTNWKREKRDQNIHARKYKNQKKKKAEKVMVQSLATLPSSATVQARTLLVYTDSTSTGLLSLRGIHPLLNIGCKAIECLLDVDVILCRDLQERDTKFVGELLALFG